MRIFWHLPVNQTLCKDAYGKKPRERDSLEDEQEGPGIVAFIASDTFPQENKDGPFTVHWLLGQVRIRGLTLKKIIIKKGKKKEKENMRFVNECLSSSTG